MATELVSVRGGTVTETALILPDNLSEKRWLEIGEELGKMERSVGWWIGDWYIHGLDNLNATDLIKKNTGWTGPAYQSCVNAANCCRKFPSNRRRLLVPFTHHMEVSSLPFEEADGLLAKAEQAKLETGKLEPARMLRQHVKSRRRAEREEELAEDIELASEELGSQLFGVIVADPPWRFEPRSRETGMDRAADNHYPTMTTEDIEAKQPPAADDCALFLWATVPMLLEAIDLMGAWGFTYKSNSVWVKPRPGTGYWWRNCHEILLLGIKGSVPAPAPGEQYDSVFQGDLAAHSVKPAAAYEMIEDMFPNAALLEMYGRGPRYGWEVWGAEAERWSPTDSPPPESEEEQTVKDSRESGGAALFEDAHGSADGERVA
jgi:N6-adenosine-specific RNA methylase IME4